MSGSDPHAYQTAFSYCKALLNNTAATNKAASANLDITIEYDTCGNVAMIFYSYVVFNQCTSINDTVVSYTGTGIDDSAMHNDAARTKIGVPWDMGGRGYDDWQLKPELYSLLIKANAVLGSLYLPDGDQGILTGFSKFW